MGCQAKSDDSFWVTLDLLVEREWRKKGREQGDEVQDWLDSIASRSESIDSKSPNSSPRKKDGSEKGSTRSAKEEQKRGNRKLCYRIVKKTEEELVEELAEEINELLKPLILDVRFSTVKVRARLDRLMGSNMVRLTDRKYMQRLQVRIREDYVIQLDKRIKERAARERDREKALLLAGHIPMSQCPPELANHPVFVINRQTKKIISARRAKMQTPAAKALKYLKDLAAAIGPADEDFKEEEQHEIQEATGEVVPESDSGEEEEEDDPYTLTDEEFDRLWYEDPRVKQLRTLETVEELYDLADEIVGQLPQKF